MPNLSTHPIHLGLGATAVSQPEFTGEMAWYMDYATRNAADGAEGRLVTIHSFSESWDSWEMHPNGDEFVYLLAGAVELRLETDAGLAETTLCDSGAVLIPRGVWHTARVKAPSRMLHVTLGAGTQTRPA